MISKTKHSSVHTAINVITILALLAVMGANVTSASAATLPPKNDDFSLATKFTSGVSQTVGDINLATSDTNGYFDPPLNCDGGGFGEATVFYTFTPPSAGELVITRAYSGYDTIITVFKAMYDWTIPGSDPSTLYELGCNDDASALTTTSKLTISLRGGTMYYIEVARKSGSATSAPDPLKFIARWYPKVTANEGLHDAFQTPPFYYTPVGWTPRLILPGITHNNNIAIGNNPGDTAIVFYDGDPVEICYVKGPEMGSLDVYIDGLSAGSINQGNGTYLYDCQTFWYAGPFELDNVHKIVFQHGGPAGSKVNIDTIEVFPHADFWDPDPIYDLVLPDKYTTGTNPPLPPTSKAVMQWTAPGDDGLYGRVHHYDVRYISDADWTLLGGNDPWDQATWDAATPIIAGLPAPTVGGKLQTMTVSGLPIGIFHFNVVGVDEAGNPIQPCGFCFSNDYAYEITQLGTGVFGPGMYDDRFAGLKYSGKWKNVSSPDNYKNTIRVATKVDSAVQFSFTGSQFRYFYNTGYNLGLVDVYLDGIYLTTIDQYTPLPHRWQYVSPMMSYGPHTIRLVMTTLKYITIDAIMVAGITDGGPPDPIIDLGAAPGATDGSVDLTWTASGDDPGDLPGVGTATQYEVRYSLTGPITNEFEWLTADPAPGFVPIPNVNGSAESMSVTGLVPGFTYWFAVRATDDAGYSVLSNPASAQAAVVSYVYSGAGFYEDSDVSGPSWIYYGAWIWDNSLPNASGGDEHITNFSGNSAVFLFNGTGFTLTFQKKSGFGILKVYVDGVLVGEINQHNGILLWQQTWNSPVFAAGNHTVQFLSGGKTNIDAITILP